MKFDNLGKQCLLKTVLIKHCTTYTYFIPYLSPIRLYGFKG